MEISIIAAMDRARGIGLAGQLPWRLSADLKQFKKRTMGHTLIQGRKTWESIGRPLPGRRMVVLTRQADYAVPDGVTVCHSLADALDFARENGDEEAFIGGGANVFADALDIADRIYLTRVDAVVESDTYFPAFDESEWFVQTLESHPQDERNEHAFRLDVLERKTKFLQGEELMTEYFSDLITFLYTRDLKTTSSFYEDVLGLEMVLDQGSCRVYRVTERGYVGYCERDNAPEKPEGVILTLVTDEVDAWAERLAAAGVALEKPPTLNEVYNIYHIFFRDPNGYLLEIQCFMNSDWNVPAKE